VSPSRRIFIGYPGPGNLLQQCVLPDVTRSYRSGDDTMRIPRFVGAAITAVGIVGLSAGTSFAAASAPSASTYKVASAVGYAKMNAACVSVAGKNLCWPGGLLGHTIKGSGRTITNEEASVSDLAGADVVGGVYCNWRIDFDYYDTGGNLYLSRKGTQHSSCTAITDNPIGQRQTGDITLAHYGRACAQFGANGKVQAKQCHNITS
jgi:hypothetical protein